MKFDWIPVTPDTVPDKTKEANELYYLVTILHEDGARETIVSNWGPVSPDRLKKYKDDPLYKNYNFDDWAFGDWWSDGIDTVDRAIAWAYMPGPYMGEIAVRKADILEDS